MRDWTLSTGSTDPIPAAALAEQTHLPLTRPRREPGTFLLHGSDQARIAASAQAALRAGHRLVLLPGPPTGALPNGIAVRIDEHQVRADAYTGTGTRCGWDVAMFTSGSTTGTPRGYGFTRAQLDQVTAWYEEIYQVTKDSIIVTALPAAYNFTFVAGVLLAARLGARLHLSRSLTHVLHDAKQLAGSTDRLIVLANPIVLDQAEATGPLPCNVLVDSGGAPLSTTAISYYRDHGIDLREGYGLTETASLTHFDAEASPRSLGTVGAAMPGVRTSIDTTDGKPIVEVASPATGIPLDPTEPPPGDRLRTTDLGAIDEQGRLRLLGRADDEQINGLWPRDTLDALGPLLGRRCALVRHHPNGASIRLLAALDEAEAAVLHARAAEILDLPAERISITSQDRPLLYSAKLTRTTGILT